MFAAIGALFISWDALPELFATLSLIFGGCCSNALTLEIITSQYAPTGTLLTFAQFLAVTVVGLSKQLFVLPYRIPRQEGVQRVAKMIVCAKANFISVYGSDERISEEFVQELSSAVEGTITETTEQDPDPGYENRSVSFVATGKHFNIVRDSCKKGDSSSCFNVLLQTEPVFCHRLDAVIDISAPEYPAFLYPHSFGHFFNPLRYRLKRRKIPISRYIVQVLLFLLISLLNNAAFAYHVPMAVHIIFRSGGLVVNMLLGWAFEKRRYSRLQVGSVVLVTLGVILTTLSSTQAKSRSSTRPFTNGNDYSSSVVTSTSYGKYTVGILILTLALVLSGALGIAQDRTLERYGRGNWEEAMFYLHALALPLFGFTWPGLVAQLRAVRNGPQLLLFGGTTSNTLSPLPYLQIRSPSLWIPSFYIPLALNVFTQLICVAGVNRLTSRVNSLTVSLVLVVRKAVSLGISVLLLGSSRGNAYLWLGAAAVLIGTIGYALGSTPKLLKDE
ncbi:YEA4_2 [Sanghuangporus vaninii]